MFIVTDLYIYPVKSLGGFRVQEATVTPTGLLHDRRWMLIDKDNVFLTQRQFPVMALLQTSITPEGLFIYHKDFPEKNISIPFLFSPSAIKRVKVWDDMVDVWCYSNTVNAWFSDMLNTTCELVYMPDETKRMVDPEFAKNKEVTSLSDGYPFLLLGQSSLDELNSKLDEPLSMDRFRPNIVFKNGAPHIEDSWQHFLINGINFFGVKTCFRCLVTTIDQQTAIPGKEPLKTLASYRSVNNRIKFGMNLLHKGEGTIMTGDKIIINNY